MALDILTAGAYGLGGGVLRALVGFGKAMKKQKFNGPYFALTAVIGMVIGVVVGIILNFDWRLSLIGGYAGTDFLEGIARVMREGRGWGLIKPK